MPTNHRIQLTVEIAAPVARVFAVMLDPAHYRDWTSAFDNGSHYEGTWQQGGQIRFLSSTGSGLRSEVVEHRPNEFTSLRHLGWIGIDPTDPASGVTSDWLPAIENYTFHETPTGTRIVIDQDVADDFEQYLRDTWPKALARLREICEAGTAA